MKRCSEITQREAEFLDSHTKKVWIKEINSQYLFEAEIIDYCTEDDFGIIVQIDDKHKSKIQCLNKLSSDNPNHFELDLRASHYGDQFILIQNRYH